MENGFSVPLEIGPKQFLDFAAHPVWAMRMLRAGSPAPANFTTSDSRTEFVRNDSRGASDWAFLDRLRKFGEGKLLVKGVNCVEDAVKINRPGVILYTFRTMVGDSWIAELPAIKSLPKIREALGDDYPIVFDSGIRSADDIVRALACGADFVMIGRPILHALGAGGPKGLAIFMNRLEEDLKSVMAQIGVTNIDEINADCIAGNQEIEND